MRHFLEAAGGSARFPLTPQGDVPILKAMLQERYTGKSVRAARYAAQNFQSKNKNDIPWIRKIIPAAVALAVVVVLASLSQATWLRTLDHVIQAILIATLLVITAGLLWVGKIAFSNLRQKNGATVFHPELALHRQTEPGTKVAPRFHQALPSRGGQTIPWRRGDCKSSHAGENRVWRR
jgi:hypothetical protein